MNRGELASRATAIVLVVLLVASPIVGAAGAMQDLGGQPDFATVPNTNVQDDLPVGEGQQTALAATQLRGSVMASAHADSLQVTVTTPERAEGYVNGTPVDAGRGDVALVFSDDYNHSGRTVAVPASAIRGALGHTPETVHGVHESGDRWADQVEQRNGLLFFEIPKFSANSVTFEGEVRLSAEAVDGSEWTYDLGPEESLSDPNVTFTGRTATEWDNVSSSGLGDGETLAIDPGGNADLRGPASGDPEVILTGEGFEQSDSASGTVSPSGSASVTVDGNMDPVDETLTLSGNRESESKEVQGEITQYETHDIPMDQDIGGVTELTVGGFYIKETSGDGGVYVDIYVIDTADGSQHKVGDRFHVTSTSTSFTDSFSTTTDVKTDGPVTIRVEWVDSSTDREDDPMRINYNSPTDVTGAWPQNVGVTVGGSTTSFGEVSSAESQSIDLGTGSNTLDFSGDSHGSLDWSLSWTERSASQDPAVDFDGDGSPEIAYSGTLTDGETATYRASELGLEDDTATISTASGSTVSVAVHLEEVTKTRDPALTLNGQTVASYTGVLEDGATYETTVDKAYLQDGQNNLSAAVGDGSLSSDAPAPAVGLEYDHRADVKIDTSYAANGWEESYEVSHTYAGDRENVAVTIPFSRTIYDVRYVDYRVNGGDWITAAESNWHLENGTRLVVEPTDTDGSPGFEAGDQLEVRTEGYKVQPQNGAITITDPTAPSEPTVNAEFRVDNRTTDFHIDVGGTTNGDRVHYLKSSSWGASEEAVISADGQDLYLSDAVEGGSAVVTTLPLEPVVASGDVGVYVEDAATPRFQVTPGKTGVGSSVTYRWYDVESGERYGIFSLDRDRFVHKTEAGDSYVALEEDDTQERFEIRGASDTSGSGDSSGSDSDVETGGGAWDDAAPDGILQQLVVGAAWAGLVVVLVAATGRSDLTGRRRWILVGALAAGSGLFSLEVLRPGSVSGAVNVGLQEIVPLAGLAVIGYVGYSLFSWWQTRQAEASTPDQVIEIGGGSN